MTELLVITRWSHIEVGGGEVVWLVGKYRS